MRPADADVAVRHRRRAGLRRGCLRFPRGGATLAKTRRVGHCPKRPARFRSARRLRDAWDLDSADRAARVLPGSLGAQPRRGWIREGLEETLTVSGLV